MSTELWRTRPYARDLQHIVDGFYEQAFAPFTSGNPADGGSTGFQTLPVNVWETDDAYLATLMAPGLDEKTINITMHQDTLAIERALCRRTASGDRRLCTGLIDASRVQKRNPSADPERLEITCRA
jgi:HSP20 family molecular chaperone IbpA